MPDNRKEQRGMKTFINSGKNNITDLVIKFALKSPYVACNRLEQSYVVHGGKIVAGTDPDGLSFAETMKNIPEDWNEQRKLFVFPER